MKKAKAISIIGIIALIAAIMVMPAAAFEPGECDTTVCASGCDYSSIQFAIQGASEGDTICVYNGTYGGLPTCHYYGPCDYSSKCFEFCKPNITVKGEGADVVTFDGGNSHNIGFGDGNSDARGCILEGFKIVNAPKGVFMEPTAPDCIIRNCVFEGLSGNWGISLSTNTTFMNNVILNSDIKYGILKPYGGSCIIANNTIINSKGAGIMLYKPSTANNIITRNSIISCGKGIWLYKAGEGNKIYLNNFIDNGVSVAITSTTTTQFWNSTEPMEYVCPTDGNTYTNYLGNYWSDHPGGAEDGCGIWDTPYGIPGSTTGEKDYRPLMDKFENYQEPVPAQPDLTPTEVTTAALLLLNQSSVVNASIANVGTADAGGFNVSLSADGTVVDTASVESLGIGNTTNVSFEWIPSSIGNVTLCVVADSDGTVAELSETNNDKCVVVTVVAPDLVPTAMTPDAFFPGKPNTITATIENMGDADAGSFNVALSVDGTEVDTASAASLGDGASTEVSFSWMATVGDHELCVLADTDSEVDESDEGNNELCKDVTVYPNTVYLVPKDSGAPYCCEAEVEVWVKAEDGFQGGQINLTYSQDCANVTGVEFNPVWDFESATWWDTYEGYTRISFAKSEGMVSGDIRIGTLKIHCTSEDIDTLCSTTLSYAPVTKLVNDFGTEIETNWIEGTFGCDLAKVRIEPETLNLKSKGVFTAFITLPAPYDIADINVSTVECEGASVVNSSIIPGIDTLRVKFDREDLRKDLPAGDAVTMRVTGEMQTGKIFEGRDTIRVIA